MATGWKISEGDHFPGQVTSLAHIGTVNKIVKDKLSPKQLEMLKRTIFRRFVDIDLVFNTPLSTTFSKDEFLLTTDLWLPLTGVVWNEKASEELERKYFSNR